MVAQQRRLDISVDCRLFLGTIDGNLLQHSWSRFSQYRPSHKHHTASRNYPSSYLFTGARCSVPASAQSSRTTSPLLSARCGRNGSGTWISWSLRAPRGRTPL